MIEKTVSIYGSPEILINNAGIAVFDDPLKLSEEDWKKMFFSRSRWCLVWMSTCTSLYVG